MTHLQDLITSPQWSPQISLWGQVCNDSPLRSDHQPTMISIDKSMRPSVRWITSRIWHQSTMISTDKSMRPSVRWLTSRIWHQSTMISTDKSMRPSVQWLTSRIWSPAHSRPSLAAAPSAYTSWMMMAPCHTQVSYWCLTLSQSKQLSQGDTHTTSMHACTHTRTHTHTHTHTEI